MDQIPYPEGSKAPWFTTVVAGVEQMVVMAITQLVLRQAYHLGGVSAERSGELIQGGFIVLAVALLLQLWRGAGIGSGLLVPSVFGVLFLRASIAALQSGGIPLLTGMMLVLAAVQLVAAHSHDRLRRFFPPLISALILLIVGLEAGLVGVEGLFALTQPGLLAGKSTLAYAIPGIVTLAVTVAMAVWGRGVWRVGSLAAGIAAGSLVAQWTDPEAFSTLLKALAGEMISPLRWRWEGVSFRLDLLLAFGVAGLASNMETLGCAKQAFALSRRDQLGMPSDLQRSALRSGGLANLLAAVLGTTGVVGSPGRVTLSAQMGIATRAVGCIAALLLIGLAFFPIAAHLFLAIPTAVLGAVFLYLGAIIISQGLKELMLIHLDLRRSLVLGISLIAALCALLLSSQTLELPFWLKPFFRTMLSAGVVTAVVLNLIFRIRGVKELTLMIDLGNWELVTHDLVGRLTEWGVDQDLIKRAEFDLSAMQKPLQEAGARAIAFDLTADDTTLHMRFHFSGTPGPITGTWMADHIGLDQLGTRWRVVMDYEQ